MPVTRTYRYHVMHIGLPDRQSIANHFRLQAFLSEQSFPSVPMSCSSSSTVISSLLFFIKLQIAASSNFTHTMAVDIV